MTVNDKSSHAQGKSPKIKKGKSYTNSLEVLFYEGVKLSGGKALEISQLLTDHHIDHVFVGGIVVGCHSGRPRSTQDVDLIIGENELPSKLLKLLGKIVGSKKVERHPSFITFLKSSVIGDREVLDLITSKSGSYGLVFSNYAEIKIDDVCIKIPTAEMMVVLKYTAAMNPIRSRAKQTQDWADLLAIVDANNKLDINKVTILADGILPGFGEDLKSKILNHKFFDPNNIGPTR